MHMYVYKRVHSTYILREGKESLYENNECLGKSLLIQLRESENKDDILRRITHDCRHVHTRSSNIRIHGGSIGLQRDMMSFIHQVFRTRASGRRRRIALMQG